MRLRKLALAVGLAGSLGVNLANALGLGEITLNSTLNQPLDADIRLLQVRDLSPDEILVNLASREDFIQAGVDRYFFLTDMKFTIDLNNASGPLVKITSSQPVREPYLNFLVESQWPSGRIMREYTLLMDLPTFGDQAVRPVEAARATTAPREPAVRQSDRPRQTRPAPRQQQASYDGDVYGPVGASDTLWAIALRVKPSAGTSVQQTMLALQRLNPEAFINGNINLLKRGSVLRVPSEDQIERVTRRQALNEVAQQNNSWSGQPDDNMGAQLDAGSRASSERQPLSSGQGRVKLASPSSTQGSGQGAGSVDGGAEALENELAISLEELDKSKRENQELNSRITDLEEQLGTMERLVNVSNNELKTLQLALEERRNQIAEGQGDSATAVPAADPLASAIDAGQAEAEATKAEADESPASEPAAAPAVAKTQPKAAVKSRTVVSQPKEPSLLDLLMENILFVAGGLIAIIGAAVMMLRRKESEPEEDLEDYDVLDDDQLIDDGDDTLEPELVEETEEGNGFIEEQDEESYEETEEAGTEAETDDVVGEADIYIAYGKFEQAEEMLSHHLDREPGNTAARLKLMEVYTETGNLEAFDQQFRQVHNLDDGSAVQRAAELRAAFVDAPEFDADALGENSLDPMEMQEDFAEESGQEDGIETEHVDDSLVELDFELPESEGDKDVEESAVEEEALDSEIDQHSELSLDLDEGFEEEGSADQEDTSDSLELSLEEAGDELENVDFGDLSAGDDEEFSLDLDLSDELSDVGDGEALDLDLDLDLAAEPEADSAEDTPDDLPDEAISLALDTDLELGADAEAASDPVEPSEDALEDDGFDMGDLDLEALDKEMDDMDLDALDAEIDELSSDSGESADESAAPVELALEEEESIDLDLSLGESDAGSLDLSLGDDDSASLDFSSEEEESTSLDLSLEDDETGSLDIALEETESESLDLSDELTLSEEDGGEFDLDLAFDSDDNNETDLSVDEGLTFEAAEDEAAEDETSDALELDMGDLAAVEAEEAVDEELQALDNDIEALEAEVFEGLPTEADAAPGDAEEEISFDLSDDDDDMENDLDFLADADEVTTKLDLARAYIDMGDADGAKDILGEVVEEGNDQQRKEAEDLIATL